MAGPTPTASAKGFYMSICDLRVLFYFVLLHSFFPHLGYADTCCSSVPYCGPLNSIAIDYLDWEDENTNSSYKFAVVADTHTLSGGISEGFRDILDELENLSDGSQRVSFVIVVGDGIDGADLDECDAWEEHYFACLDFMVTTGIAVFHVVGNHDTSGDFGSDNTSVIPFDNYSWFLGDPDFVFDFNSDVASVYSRFGIINNAQYVVNHEDDEVACSFYSYYSGDCGVSPYWDVENFGRRSWNDPDVNPHCRYCIMDDQLDLIESWFDFSFAPFSPKYKFSFTHIPTCCDNASTYFGISSIGVECYEGSEGHTFDKESYFLYQDIISSNGVTLAFAGHKHPSRAEKNYCCTNGKCTWNIVGRSDNTAYSPWQLVEVSSSGVNLVACDNSDCSVEEWKLDPEFSPVLYVPAISLLFS